MENFSYIATINAEIRQAKIETGSFTTKEGKEVNYNYILIKALDEEDNSFFIKDKRIENIEQYKRGTIGAFKIKVDIDNSFNGKGKPTITLLGWKEEE